MVDGTKYFFCDAVATNVTMSRHSFVRPTVATLKFIKWTFLLLKYLWINCCRLQLHQIQRWLVAFLTAHLFISPSSAEKANSSVKKICSRKNKDSRNITMKNNTDTHTSLVNETHSIPSFILPLMYHIPYRQKMKKEKVRIVFVSAAAVTWRTIQKNNIFGLMHRTTMDDTQEKNASDDTRTW